MKIIYNMNVIRMSTITTLQLIDNDHEFSYIDDKNFGILWEMSDHFMSRPMIWIKNRDYEVTGFFIWNVSNECTKLSTYSFCSCLWVSKWRKINIYEHERSHVDKFRFKCTSSILGEITTKVLRQLSSPPYLVWGNTSFSQLDLLPDLFSSRISLIIMIITYSLQTLHSTFHLASAPACSPLGFKRCCNWNNKSSAAQALTLKRVNRQKTWCYRFCDLVFQRTNHWQWQELDIKYERFD